MAENGGPNVDTGGTAMSPPVRFASFDTALIAEWAGGAWAGGRVPPVAVSGFSFDARTLRRGECFTALSSGARDGHDFVGQALEAGASCALVERALEVPIPQLVVDDSLLALGRLGSAVRERFAGPVVGVTGSCGKTSTKEMLRLLLGVEETHATPGNWNNRIGVPMALLGLDSVRHAQAVIEAGINEPGEMAHLGAMIRADLVVVTQIGTAHLEGLGSREGIAREKAELAARAKPDAPLFLPADCLQFEAFRELVARARVLCRDGEAMPDGVADCARYGTEPAGPGRSRIRIREGDRVAEFELASASPGICRNAALAVLAARFLRVPDDRIRMRLAGWQPARDRGAVRARGDQLVYVDCYNANPSSMADALTTFALTAPAGQPRLYVLGAMEELGAEAVGLHREAGAGVPLRPGDRVLLVGPDALTKAYREGILMSGVTPVRIGRGTSAEKFYSEVAQFKGAVFLKGSRRYRLEDLLAPAS